jgi:signal transduction histidine kinase/ActR/RegA family two-component response regulator
MEKAKEFNSDLLLQVVSALDFPYIILTDKFQLIDCNQYFLDLISRDFESISKKEISSFLDKNTINQLQIENNDHSLNNILCFEQGSQSKKFTFTLQNICCNGLKYRAYLFKDVTKEVELKDRILKANNALEELKKLKTSFIANISHEMRTPINGILGMAELLQETPLGEDQSVYTDSIVTSSKALMTVVNDILEYSVAESGDLNIQNEPFSIHEVIRTLEVTFKHQFKKKKVDLFCDVDNTLPDYTLGDGPRLLQAITSLVSNCLKFTLPDGLVWISFRKEFNEDNKERLVVYIFDSGIGISESKIKSVIDPFIQGDSSLTRSCGGLGLGLSTAIKIIEYMKGSITFRSKSRVGTMVKIDVPLTKAINDDILIYETKNQEGKRKPINILVAEDNKVNQLLISKILERAGYNPVIAEDGEQAVQMNSKQKFDLILMDIQMPKLDGESATEVIRRSSINSNVPIVALTANAYKSDTDKYLAIGMNGHVAKPIIKSELFAVIDQFVKNT